MIKEQENEAWGDYPSNDVPGEILVDGVANPLHLREMVSEYLLNNRNILKGAKAHGQDIVAFAASHGKVLIIGVGVAGVLAGGLIIYPRWKARRQKLKFNESHS